MAPGAPKGARAAEARAACRFCATWSSLDGARSAFLYAGGVRSWVHALKYGGAEGLGELAGEPLARLWAETPAAWRPAAVIVPVPLHTARRRERGYNQASRIAAALAVRVGLPCVEVLERPLATQRQARLAAPRRAANVRGAFRVRHGMLALCSGRALALVDDVLTTGATLEACAAALRDAGSGPVYALTLARAVPGEDA